MLRLAFSAIVAVKIKASLIAPLKSRGINLANKCGNHGNGHGSSESQTDAYSLSQAAYLSIRFRADGLVCVITCRKSAVVTVSSLMAEMSEFPVEKRQNKITDGTFEAAV